MRFPKYMRIQGRSTSFKTKLPVGIFTLGWRQIKNSVFTEEEKQAFLDVDDWFKENLPEPPMYLTNNTEGAIVFFKTETSSDMVEKLIPIMNAFKKHNIAFDIVYTDYVGKIIYEDPYQVAVIYGEETDAT